MSWIEHPKVVPWRERSRAVDFALETIDAYSRHRTGRDPSGGFARAGSPAAAIIAQAVFRIIGIIRMAGAIGLRDFGIVLGTLIHILDHQADRRSRGSRPVGPVIFKYAGEDFHLVGLSPLGGVPRGTRLAAIQIALQIGLGQRHAGRTAIDDATDRGSVGLAERGDGEQLADGVAGHGINCRLRKEPNHSEARRKGHAQRLSDTSD